MRACQHSRARGSSGSEEKEFSEYLGILRQTDVAVDPLISQIFIHNRKAIKRRQHMNSVVGEMGTVEVQAFVLFKVNSGMEKEVSKQLAELEEVQEASITYGEYDVIAKITVKDLHLLEDFLADKIRKVQGVVLTSTMIIAQEFKGKKQRPTK